MIVVVEGISAAGKTTWCRKNAAGFLVEGTFPADQQIVPAEEPTAAQFWTDWNAKRWSQALMVESCEGLAVCDTDPLRLHYLWSSWQIGEAPDWQWHLQLEKTRQAFSDCRIGFADLYLVKKIDPAIARQQRDNDIAHVRDRFDLHVRLHKPLLSWYRALETVLCGHVLWRLPDEFRIAQCRIENNFRYNLEKFDAFVGYLPRP